MFFLLPVEKKESGGKVAFGDKKKKYCDDLFEETRKVIEMFTHELEKGKYADILVELEQHKVTADLSARKSAEDSTHPASESKMVSHGVKELVDELEKSLTLTSKGRSFKQVYDIYGSDEKVASWKFNEWDYGRNNVHLPCNARGLFISVDPKNPRIVARGYDKFFNIDEVYCTKWDWIEKNTVGPYEVTVKANGCIIFVSGLEDGTLVVCSKHSTGPREDVDRNHSEAGRMFLEKQLEDHSIDKEVFAKELYRRNITAVAEYCDDTFEEHILEYKGDKRGLYLHGVNLNTPEFETWPMGKVTEFAEKYGFKTIDSFQKDDLTSLRTFLDECSEKGTYQGMEVEGFVIRCHLSDDHKKAFFFKFKFEEPYLMYRQWREVTKNYITTKKRTFKFRKHSFITNKYLDFVTPLLDDDPKLCEDYLKGFGIIKLRNMFLDSYGMTGLEVLNYEKVKELEMKNAIDYDKVDEHTKFLIFPISVIGCGKTTVARVLTTLYKGKWGHVQSDDIRGKDKSVLIKRSLEMLSNPDVKCVFVDRNNHQYRERQQLFDWVEEFKEDFLPYDTNIKIIGVSFTSPDEFDEMKKITVDRVFERGDNHQTIKLNDYGEKKVLGIMSGFWKRYQPMNVSKSPDDLFDFTIQLSVLGDNSSLNNTRTIIERLHKEYAVLIPELPTEQDLERAFQEALSHKVEIASKIAGRGGKPRIKKVKATFFAVRVPKEYILEQIKALMEKNCNLEGIDLLRPLFSENRTQEKFHITLAHIIQGKRGDTRSKSIWKAYNDHYEPLMVTIAQQNADMKQKMGEKNSTFEPPKVVNTGESTRYRLSELCWDDKIVAVTVDLVHGADNSCVYNAEGKAVPGLDCSNTYPHITVGILKEGTKPVYSNSLCEEIARMRAEGVEPEVNGVYHLEFNDQDELTGDVYIDMS